MKNKIVLIIITLSAITAFTGCEKFLTDKPQSVLTQVNFYTTPVRINQGVLGCYAGMASITNDEWMFTEIRSDNTCVNNSGTGSTVRVDMCDMKFFRTSPSLPMVRDFWYKIFQNISNINAVLPSVADNKYVTLEAQRAQYEGELLFMRAYHYFQLVCLWGDMFKITSVIGPNEAKKIERSPASEIYDEIIIPDLVKAAGEALPVYPGIETGRITKWAAKSLLAKVYMMIGGADNLAKAKPLLEEVLTASPHGLLTGTGAYAKVFDITNEMNSEIIFAVRYKGGALGIGSPFWGTFAPDGSGNTILKIGTPVGNNNPTFEIMAKFNEDPKDTRKATCYGVWYKTPTTPLQYISKYTDATMALALQSENDWIVIRYADIVLLYAEVLAQDGNHAIAHNEVNKTRVRAGMDPILTPFASQEVALDSVYNERRKELAFENQRWFDLLRMGKSYNTPDKAVAILRKHTFVTDWLVLYSKYNPILPPEDRFFKIERLLLPIPQAEIDTNNEIPIKQNDDY
ncbi:MAG: RagB/SusD family nutrient uptake outer membrane protein [Bacteroidia bacterium]|nr:RagB/SusD family nutrient uptake outer membrane protein [Bacteroidia bacterium]